ncbi:MAG: lytic transglycosylase domain-containing protein [Bdellovibrionota bacterium]
MLFAAVASLGFPVVASATTGPRIAAPTQSIIKKCFKRIDEPVVAKFFSKNLEWELTCPLDELQKQIASKDAATWPPHVNLLVAHKLYEEYLKFRANFFVQAAEETRYESPQGFFWSPLLENRDQIKTPHQDLGPHETPFAAFSAASSQWMESFTKLLEPQLKDSKNSTYFKEAALLWMQILGASGQMSALTTELDGRLAPLMSVSADRDFVLRTLFEFSARRSSDAAVLKPFLLKSLSYLKTLNKKTLENEHLDLWVQYLMLQGVPETRVARDEVLKTLRDLWILFPLNTHKIQIRKLAIDLGVSQFFIGPSERQLKIDELLTEADRQIRLLVGNEALKTLDQVLRLPSQQYTSSELWDALELHVRLLRILDRRHEIPELLTRYVKKGHFLDIPSKQTEREDFFSRLYQIGRWQWSYDTPEKALATFDRIISLNRAWGSDFQLAASYYIRARIMEQSSDRRVARLYFEEAIQELKDRAKKNSDLFEDLLWRRFYNEYDLASGNKNYALLLQLIDELKPYVLWDEDGERWLFWRGLARLSAGMKDKAIEDLKEAHRKAPLSYYSVVAGLELVKLEEKPADWKLPDASSFWLADGTWDEPSFSDHFDTKTLKPKNAADLPWAQVYGLGAIGRFTDARRYLSNLEKRLYSLAGAKGKSLKERRKALQRGAWLRLGVGDQIGSLRMGELARITFEGQLEAEELAYLYPLPFKKLIEDSANERHVDPWHAISLIRQESAFNPQARSSANALGLMQIIPPVAEKEARKLGIKDFRPEQLNDPSMSVRIGSFHLGELYSHFESSLITSTAAYNAGRPPVYAWITHYSHPIPYVFIDRISFAETRKYVRSILRNYINYSRIYGGGKIDIDALLKMPASMPGDSVDEAPPQDTL